MKKVTQKTKTDWENISEWYDTYLGTDNDSYHSKVVIPNLLRLLGDFKGKKILDLGCGNGIVAKLLAQQGGIIFGVDGSTSLINKAKQNASDKEKYYVHDVRVGLPKDAVEIDHCISVLSIQNMDSIHSVFKHVRSSLSSKGSFHIVTLHPAFRIPKESDWVFDEKRKKQGRVVFNYMSESKISILQNPSNKNSPTSITFHRPLQVYSKTLQNNYFTIKRIEEWCSHKESSPGKRKNAEDIARKEIPMFLYIEAICVQ